MKHAPVALFTYNRPIHTQRTVEALLLNERSPQTDLFVFSDGPGDDFSAADVKAVRNYVKSIKGFNSVSVIERQTNIGLAANIIDGVGQISTRFGKVIVLEDDLLTSPYFLDFMNEGLDLYEPDEKVISIHGYLPPLREELPDTFFLRGADCWGWATWKRGWELFETDGRLLREKLQASGEINHFEFGGNYPYLQMLDDQVSGKRDSWAIRWYASAFLENRLTLYPGKSLITNIGDDGSGTNHGVGHETQDAFYRQPIKIKPVETRENMDAYQAFSAYYHRVRHPSLLDRIKRKTKIVFRKIAS